MNEEGGAVIAAAGTPRVTRRRLLAATLTGAAGTLSTAALAACGRQIDRTPVQISWYSWGPEYPQQWTVGPGLNPRQQPNFGQGQATPVPPEQVLQQQIAAFTADRDDLTVKIMTERPEKYHDKLLAMATAGQLPDVCAYDSPQAIPLVKSGLLYHLGRLQGASSRSFLQAFATPYIEASSYRGKLYGVPYQSRQLVLYVNKTAFSGLSLPPVEWGNPDWTWAHFLEKATALTQRAFSGGIRQFGTLLGGRPMWAALIRQNAGQEFNKDISRSYYDSPEVYEAIQWAADLVWRYHIAPTPQQNPQGRNYNFDTGNVAMWIWYQHSTPVVNSRVFNNFDWDIYPLPMNRKAATYAEWGYLSISSNPTDLDRAWELVRFLSGPDGDALALRDGVAGPIQKGTEPRFMTGAGASKNKAAAIQAAQQPIATRPLHDAWAQITSLQDYYLGTVWSGNEKAVYAARNLRLAVDGVLAGLETPKQPAVGADDSGASAAGGGGDSGGGGG